MQYNNEKIINGFLIILLERLIEQTSQFDIAQLPQFWILGLNIAFIFHDVFN